MTMAKARRRSRGVKSLKKRGDVAGLLEYARGEVIPWVATNWSHSPQGLVSLGTQTAAIKALGDLGTDEAIQALTALADDADFGMRSQVVSVLGPKYIQKLLAARDLGGLIGTLHSGDPVVRAEAARALGELGDPSTLPSLLALLSVRGPTKDNRTIVAAKDAVRRIGTVERLIEIMKGGADADARNGATVALGLWKDPGAVDDLVSLVEDPQADMGLRSAATYSLALIGDQRAVGPIVAFFVDRLRELAKQGYTGTPELLDGILDHAGEVKALAAFGPVAGPYLRASRDGEHDQFVRIGIERVLLRTEKWPLSEGVTQPTVRCSRCERTLEPESMVGGGTVVVGARPPRLYPGVICTSCKKIECVTCKGSPADAPCSWCASAVEPAFEHLVLEEPMLAKEQPSPPAPPAAATSPSRIAEIVGRWPPGPAGVCDICSDPIVPESCHLVPAAEFQGMVRKGYNPHTTGRIKGTQLGSLSTALGLSDETAKAGWKAMALGSSTDWGLCRRCAEDVALFIGG